MTKVLQGLTSCTREEITEALGRVEDRRAQWSDHTFYMERPFINKTKQRRLKGKELEYCLMVFTYTDDVLFGKVSRLLNNPKARMDPVRSAEVEGALFWISCIRHSVIRLEESFPEWIHTGKKWRGMKFRFDDVTSHFKERTEVAWYTIKSTTYDETLMQKNAFAGLTGPRTIFEIEECDALDVSQISKYPEESECLLLPGSFFTIRSSTEGDMKDGDPFKRADVVRLTYIGNDIAQCLNQLEYKHENHVVVIGNPGSGKSTLLNRYAESYLFPAGWACGSGLTDDLQAKEFTDSRNQKGLLLDMPGLLDIKPEKKEAAASAIFHALMMVPSFRIFFVLTLEEGRYKPQDLEAVRLVLEACADIADKLCYGVIINKFDAPPWVNSEISRETLREMFRQYLSQYLERGKIGSFHFHFAPREEALLKGNRCAPLPAKTLKFMRELPPTQRHVEIDKVNITAYRHLADEVKTLHKKVAKEVKDKHWWRTKFSISGIVLLVAVILLVVFSKQLCKMGEAVDVLIEKADGLNQQNHDLNEQNGQLNRQVGDLNQEKTQMHQDNAKLNRQVGDLNQEKAQMHQDNARLNRKTVELKNSNEEMRAAKLRAETVAESWAPYYSRRLWGPPYVQQHVVRWFHRQ